MLSLLLVAAILATGAGLVRRGVVSAQADAAGQSLVEKIATRFHLSQSDVQEVFDDYENTREEQFKQDFSDRLQTLVDDGTITAEQKTLIEDKLQQLLDERDSNRNKFENLTRKERRDLIIKKRAELKQWAKDNGIPTDILSKIFRHALGPKAPPQHDF
jgi:hypothetical protein